MSEVIWNNSTEILIKSLGEKSLSLSWLHSQCEKRYTYFNNYLAIPSIILSTITGAGSIGFNDIQNVSFIMGAISIFVSIISTLNSFFSFAKRAESHRITAISYSKLYLQINIELALPRDKRMKVKEFMKNVSEQIQRLNEIQPQLADAIIKFYNIKFKDEPNTISKPECVNGLSEIKIFNEEEIKNEIVNDIPQPLIVERQRALKEISKKPVFH